MPNLEAAIIGFDNFCKVGSKMLLDSHHDFVHVSGDFVREAGAIVMPSNKDQTTTNATAQEPAARVSDDPRLETQAEFDVWALAYRQQSDHDMMGRIRERSRSLLRQHPAFR